MRGLKVPGDEKPKPPGPVSPRREMLRLRTGKPTRPPPEELRDGRAHSRSDVDPTRPSRGLSRHPERGNHRDVTRLPLHVGRVVVAVSTRWKRRAVPSH